MGGFQWIRKKLQKVDRIRKGAKQIFVGKKQKEDCLHLLDQSEYEDELDYAEIEMGYRNIMETLDQLKTVQDSKLPKENVQAFIDEAHEPSKSEPKYAGQKLIEEAMEDIKVEYTFEAILNMGTYGSVCQLVHKTTDKRVAAKIVLKKEVGDYEVDLWATLEHPHILPLLKTLETVKYQVFLSPLMEGSLENAVKNGKLTFAQMRHYLQGALQGLNYLHANGMCHLEQRSQRRWKGNPLRLWISCSQNLGLRQVRIVNFLVSFLCCSFITKSRNLTPRYHGYSDCVGMPDWYRPPEASIHYGLEAPIPSGEACDQWGCGIMLMELCSDFPILRAKPEEGNWLKHVCPVLIQALQPESFVERAQSIYNEVDSITAFLHLLIMDFLEISPSKRSTVEIALHHDFF
ncbi:hypothetical protein JTE90_005338 [Oedothorax gibbosus]|uniref:Protein kinase domain-containing protein n=1 Tax=Oedothorax gibbosus TaxID=931172 RepID=A0AAV6UI74_9ARAC|nr:hypothetical protein JTE90_005338 [Oedothorax gibbosus]